MLFVFPFVILNDYVYVVKILGPMVGGLLYQIGGFFLPFFTLGMLLFFTAIITLCVLPKHSETLQQGHSNGKNRMAKVVEKSKNEFEEKTKNRRYSLVVSVSILSLLRVPGIAVSAISIMATSASIGFLGATLEPHLRQFDLSPVLLG